MIKIISKVFLCCGVVLSLSIFTYPQETKREFSLKTGGIVEINNPFGKIELQASGENENIVSLQIITPNALPQSDLKIDKSGSKIKIVVLRQKGNSRVDLLVKVPLRTKVRLETDEGQIHVGGNLKDIQAKSNTGTIYADVPLVDVKYKFIWWASRPRIVSEVELEDYKEKSAGKFVIKGKIKGKREISITEVPNDIDEESETKKPLPKDISLKFRTARGIILLNVPPNEVPSDLTERRLTNAAKAVIRSGDTLLTEAIRRASPKHFGDYASTLPPRKNTPFLSESAKRTAETQASVKNVNVQVVDINNRSIANLNESDFVLTERGNEREILSVKPTTSPFNLVLLLDVSGSVENYVDFIRKAARNFVNTIGSQDKLSIVIFNEDVKTISTFTTDKDALSESLDTFDAGGGTAYYDSIAYVLTDTLKPMKGERTAIVVLSDGDDNKSFLSFKSLLGSIQESGALVYPLYVPSGLIAASESDDPNKTSDPLRNRFLSLTLTSEAQQEGEELARISGGVYYPISQASELQTAYNDIVKQLRTAYTITYRSDMKELSGGRASPRLKVKVKKENAFVKLGTVVAVENKQVSATTIKSSTWSSRHWAFASNFDSVNTSFSRKPQGLPNGRQDNNVTVELTEITGEIDSIKYEQFVADKLKTRSFETFNLNKSPGAFLLDKDGETVAISRWISPKRTRSYPYERVYDTLAHKGKRIAIIPVVKDEGLGGDRDFIQWDTISLLSLLDVHVVLAFYNDAIKNPKRKDKITKQKFDNEFVKSRLNEIFKFKGTARDWNEQESKNLKEIFTKAKLAYREISKKTQTYLHNEDRLDERIKYAETPQRFIGYSRRRARKAQTREFLTIQPNEALSTLSKAKLTINNALYGKYYFTVDETIIEPKTISLIEAKHSRRSKMPSKNDIKDGLIKMMLYTNLQKVKFGKKPVKYKVAIRLTSSKLEGSINSNASLREISEFTEKNSISSKKLIFIIKLFREARTNNFSIILERGETSR